MSQLKSGLPISFSEYILANITTLGPEKQISVYTRQLAFREYDAAQQAYIQSAVGSVSPSDQIASAKALLDAGTISQEEFDQLKAKALSSS